MKAPAARTDPLRGRGRPAPRGFSLVEVLVALALGLLLAASTWSLLIGQLRSHRAQGLTSRVQQELRHGLDVLLRDLRRSGLWHGAEAALQAPVPDLNPYARILPETGSATLLTYGYDRQPAAAAVQPNEHFGWRVVPANATLDLRLSGPALATGDGDAWQAVTDSGSVRVRRLQVETARWSLDLGARCELACPAGSSDCPPWVYQRRVAAQVQAHAPGEPSQVRQVSGDVGLRNDELGGHCPAEP